MAEGFRIFGRVSRSSLGVLIAIVIPPCPFSKRQNRSNQVFPHVSIGDEPIQAALDEGNVNRHRDAFHLGS